MDSMRLYATLNRHRHNQRAAGILTRPHFRWSPMTELAGLALIRHTLERGVLDCHRAIAEPEPLLARLEANPEQAMRLMTENALGDPFEIDDDPDEAARQILEEIIASIRAFPTESVAVGGGSCKTALPETPPQAEVSAWARH